MYQDEKGNFHRTDAEEHVFWGMRLLKIGFILLIISFTAYFIGSIIEINLGLEHYSINPFYYPLESSSYYSMQVFLAIFNVGFTGSIYVLGIGTLFLSRLLPEPVKKSLKITGIFYLILVPLNLLNLIIVYILQANYAYPGTPRLYNAIILTSYSAAVLEFLMLIVIALMLAKELKLMNEMQSGKNGTVVLPGILVAFFIIWLTGGIMFYVATSLPQPFSTLEPLITAAIYVEGIGQILYCATAVGVFIALLVKANKIAITPLAAMNQSGYY
ncbi:MAG: hypothetical protein ACTSQK_04340 [Candidatus Heimdallarchaeota archaeon]